jgi:hypothetical protein
MLLLISTPILSDSRNSSIWCYINSDRVFCVGVAEKKQAILKQQYWVNSRGRHL